MDLTFARVADASKTKSDAESLNLKSSCFSCGESYPSFALPLVVPGKINTVNKHRNINDGAKVFKEVSARFLAGSLTSADAVLRTVLTLKREIKAEYEVATAVSRDRQMWFAMTLRIPPSRISFDFRKTTKLCAEKDEVKDSDNSHRSHSYFFH